MALPLLPIALLGSAAIGGITSLLAGRQAANTASDTAARTEAFERDVMNRQLMQTAPYAATGYGALGDLATAYGQDLPKGFNPYSQLGQEGGFTDPAAAGGIDSAQLQRLLQLLNEDGGRNRDDDDDDDRRRGSQTPTPTTIPSNITNGNALADYLIQFRNRIDRRDRNQFDDYITQIRGMGDFSQTPAVNPNTPQGLAARRDDFISRFKSSPLYQLNYQSMMDEATKGVQRNASAAGLMNSGRTLKALQDRAGDLSNRLYGSYEGGLWNMAGFGPQPTPASSGVSNAIQSGADAGYARAAGIAGVGNAVNNALGSYAYLQGLRSNSAFQ
jgi:hypothetical protein